MLDFLRSQPFFALKCQTRELQKLSNWLLEQISAVIQRVKNVLWTLSKRFERGQTRVPSVGSFCSSIRTERRTKPVPVGECCRSPEAGLVSAFRGMLFSVLIRFANPNQLSQKFHFFDRKSKLAWCSSGTRAERRKATKENLQDLK